MISVSGKCWLEKKVNKRYVEKIQQDHDFSNILSKLIVSRNFTKDEIHLIENDLFLLNVFQNNSDFIEAVKLTENIIRNKETICILGDYDVDGSAATALLIRFLESIKHPYFYYIPDRKKDGYGASVKIFEKLILKKPKFVIMVDCGSTSFDAIDYLNKNNIKSLVIDHHEITKPFPKANIIINPKKNNGYIQYNYLCATSLTYFFLDMLKKKIQCEIDIKNFLIFVLLATVCDVMPIRNLNRLIAIIALKEFDLSKNRAFSELYKLNKKKNRININDLGYLIGPILNSGGRLGNSNDATELLSSENKNIITKKSKTLIDLNDKRKKIEAIIIKNIDFNKIEKENKNIILYYDPNLNEGLIGIIAARLKDYFNKPAFVITKSNNILKGSARSIYDYDIGRVIKNLLNEKLILNGGGHNMAAGFTLKNENLLILEKYILNDFLKKKISLESLFNYESQVSTISFKKEFFDEIKKIEPFGNGNPLPTFLFKELKIIKSSIIKEKYISCLLKSKTGKSINSISFETLDSKISEYLLNYKNYFNVIGQINEYFINNKKNYQLIIKDLIL